MFNHTKMTRRCAIQRTITATSTLAVASAFLTPNSGKTAEAQAAFTLEKLPYAYDALEPHIDARTMELHHTRHHGTQVNNLNKSLAEKPELAGRKLQDLLLNLSSLPESIRTSVRNNGGGHFNHDLFWKCMGPNAGGMPKGRILQELEKSFGSFDKFKDSFSKAAMGQFGSGWAWLIWNGSKLEVKSMPNQDAPVFAGQTALMGIDVWEHAYYLKYQNRRADYVAAFFNVINWDFVSDRLNKA